MAAEKDFVLDIDYNITKAEAKQRKLNAQWEQQKQKVEELKAKEDSLNLKRIINNKTLESQNKKFDEQLAKVEKLKQEIRDMEEAGKNRRYNNDFTLTEYGKSLRSLEQSKAALEKTGDQIQLTKARSKELNHEAVKAKLNVQSAEADLDGIGAKIIENTKKQKKFGGALKGSLNPLDQFVKRVTGLAKRVFVFSLITKALRAMREALGNYLKQDSKLSASVAKLKGNLATMGATIMNALAPYIQWVVDKLVYITSLLGNVLARILGKDIKKMSKIAQATSDTAEAAKEAEKAMAGFDTIQTIDTSHNSSGSSSSGSTSGIDTSDIESITNEQVEKFIKKLKEALPYVLMIGAALAAWKITNFLEDLGLANGKLKTLFGIFLIILGLIIFIKNYSDAWVNGINWENFVGILGGMVLVVAGLALVFGSVGVAIGLIVGGIFMVVLGIRDWITNGKSLKSVLMVVVGILAIGLGLMLAGVGWPALMVAAIVAAIVLIVAYWGEIKKAVSKFIDWFSENVLDKLFGKGVGDALKGMWESFTHFFEDILSFFKNVFTGKWEQAGKSLANIFIDELNFLINGLNSFIQRFLGGWAKLINKFGKLFGREWHLDASGIKIPNIKRYPALATGAVIPGGSPFLAMLGDQRKGQTNIEAPLETIVEAVKMAQGTPNFTIQATGSMAQLISLLRLEIKQEDKRATIF